LIGPSGIAGHRGHPLGYRADSSWREEAPVPISGGEAALAILVTALASAVQGSIGFGAGLLAAPLLLLIDPAFAPGPMLVSNLVLTLLVARREWSAVDFVALRYIVSGRAIGTVLAAGLLAAISSNGFDLLFGVLVLGAVGLCLARGGYERSPRNLSIAGLASGLMGTLSSIGGPPVVLVYQGTEPARFRATLGVHLIVGASLSLIAVWAVGRFGATELALAALLSPAALAGFWLSRFGIGFVRESHIRTAVLVLSTVSALLVLLRALT
jgi:uncharacterized membrane protein YfcA